MEGRAYREQPSLVHVTYYKLAFYTLTRVLSTHLTCFSGLVTRFPGPGIAEDLDLIEEVRQTLTLFCTLILSLSQPNLTGNQPIHSVPFEPSGICQRRPAQDPFTKPESFVQPKTPCPEHPITTTVLSFDQSANQVLEARPVMIRRRDPRNRKRTVNQVVDLSPIISHSAQMEGIDPKLVEIVIQHESAFRPTAASSVGACGLMQLMPETAKEMGVTDITDPGQNIAAGTKYLARQIHHYQDLKLALAAYNAGPGNVDHYGAVPPFEETQNYASSISSQYVSSRVARKLGS